MATDETREKAIEPHGIIGLAYPVREIILPRCQAQSVKGKDHIPTVKLKAKEVA